MSRENPLWGAPRIHGELLKLGIDIFGVEFRKDVEAMGIKEVLSAPRSPWQRAYVERVIGTIRRECLGHVIVFNQASLYRHVKSFLVLSRIGLLEEEIQALLRAAGQTGHGLARRNYALLQLLLQTGLRVGEASGEASRLAIADCEINDRSGLVRVRAGKGRKEREVPLNANVRRAIALYLKTREDYESGEPLFLSERGGQAMSLQTMQATIQELARRAKVTRIPVSAHTCRHTFALTFLRRNPGKLIELATLLGHESLYTTAVYLRASAEDLARALEEGDDE